MNKAGTLSAVREILALRTDGSRKIIAIIGPPATGKSTFSEALNDELNKNGEVRSVVVPMDGFHLDNVQLSQLGLLERKGAPETFDFDGFYSLINRLKTGQNRVFYPIFDRGLDKAIAGSGVVAAGDNVVLVEGNYLLLNEAPWSSLRGMFDHTIYLETPIATLKDRLVQRWLNHGHTEQEALDRAMSNDIPNAERVCANLIPPDQTLTL